MLKWIIQQNLINPNILKEFEAAFLNLKIAFEKIEVIPFSQELPYFTPADFNIFYGSTTLMLNAYHSEKHHKGVFYNINTFNTQNYLNQWKDSMLNTDGQVLPFQDFIKTHLHSQEKWFIRPNDDTKSFAGIVLTSQEIEEWYLKIQKVESPFLTPETVIFVSQPKVIFKEWRNFIVDKKVIDSSRYSWNQELNISKEDVPTDMIAFVESKASEYSPHDIFVMDVAETKQGFKIIECNCFNGTGFYGHHIEGIIKHITNFVEKNY